tara:strand:+ start:315 stop:593 length:279 start_codon:yes stop_codon:yes gene_type:complete
MSWKYGMIKVAEATEDMEQINMLVELYDLDRDGLYEAYAPANIINLDDLEFAYRNIHRDGINTWFFRNGKFEWTPEQDKQYVWAWTPNKEIQ